jgi:hypothetical protein
VSYTDVETGATRTVSTSEAVLTYASAGEVEGEQPNPSVMEEVALQEAAKAREEALKYDAMGDHARSVQIRRGPRASWRWPRPRRRLRRRR